MSHHPADLLSLVAGLLVLAVGLLLLSGGVGDIPLGWVGPAVAIGLGLTILLAARPKRESEHDEPAQTEEP
jgi:hypothetical protein